MRNAIAIGIGVGMKNSSSASTTFITPLSIKGGVVNGDFELAPTFVAPTTTGLKFIDGTAGGSSTVDKYVWYTLIGVPNMSFQFDSSISHTGTNSLKLSALDVTGRGRACTGPIDGATVSESIIKKYGIPVLPNTQYTLSAYCKTNNVTTNGVSVDITSFTSNGTAIAGTNKKSNKLSGTNDWTLMTVTFTTDATAAYVGLRCIFEVAGNIMDAWFDNITLTQVTSITNSSSSPALFYPSVTAVRSDDNIDQSQVTSSTTTRLGDNANNIIAQQFLPTKKYLTGAVIRKGTETGTYTGNVTVSIQGDNGSDIPNGITLVSFVIPNATWVGLTSDTDYSVMFTQTLVIIPGGKYWLVLTSSTADASNYTRLRIGTGNLYPSGVFKIFTISWTTQTDDLYFKTLYSKNTTNLTVSTDTQTVSVTAPTVDGWANGMVVGFDSPLTLAVGANAIYVASNGPATANGTVDASLQGTMAGTYVI